MQFILNINSTELFKNYDRLLSKQEIHKLNKLVEKRLNNVPIAYLVNQKEFYSINYYVNKSVLIPRPETEEMVEIALSLKPKSVLDIGTGSGVIACTIGSKLPDSQITALDISIKAINIAKKNAQSINLNNITFYKSNFLSKVPNNSYFDLIITNPPYIKNSDIKYMSPETIMYEPKLALFAGKDGLNAYRKIFSQILQKKITFKTFIGEFGATQYDQVLNLLNHAFYGKYQIRQDLNGIPRFIIIQ